MSRQAAGNDNVNGFRGLAGSKKGVMTIGGMVAMGLGGLVENYIGIPADTWAGLVGGLTGAYNVGQGIADHGKHRSFVEVNDFFDTTQETGLAPGAGRRTSARPGAAAAFAHGGPGQARSFPQAPQTDLPGGGVPGVGPGGQPQMVGGDPA